MKKVFLYLYSIKEFTKKFISCSDFNKYREKYEPLAILNECIDKRYRNNGYQIVFALYPEKNIFGIKVKEDDKIIYTDILFSESSATDELGNRKKNFILKYPNEMLLLRQLGDIDELVVGGYHAMDCVKRVAEVSMQNGINTLVDLDLTDLFFNLYDKKNYFTIDGYNPSRFKEYMINKRGPEDVEFGERIFNRNYDSPVYGFSNSEIRKR